MVKIIDDDFLDVMRHLPESWKVERWDRAGMGWIARISQGRNEFQLCSDRGYINIERIVDGKPRSCPPPEHLRIHISVDQVAQLILANCQT
jgi:hypothetical protein